MSAIVFHTNRPFTTLSGRLPNNVFRSPTITCFSSWVGLASSKGVSSEGDARLRRFKGLTVKDALFLRSLLPPNIMAGNTTVRLRVSSSRFWELFFGTNGPKASFLLLRIMVLGGVYVFFRA